MNTNCSSSKKETGQALAQPSLLPSSTRLTINQLPQSSQDSVKKEESLAKKESSKHVAKVSASKSTNLEEPKVLPKSQGGLKPKQMRKDSTETSPNKSPRNKKVKDPQASQTKLQVDTTKSTNNSKQNENQLEKPPKQASGLDSSEGAKVNNKSSSTSRIQRLQVAKSGSTNGKTSKASPINSKSHNQQATPVASEKQERDSLISKDNKSPKDETPSALKRYQKHIQKEEKTAESNKNKQLIAQHSASAQPKEDKINQDTEEDNNRNTLPSANLPTEKKQENSKKVLSPQGESKQLLPDPVLEVRSSLNSREQLASQNIFSQSKDGFNFDNQIELAKKRMQPVVSEAFEKLEGACDYFHLLERDNEAIHDRLSQQAGFDAPQIKSVKPQEADNENERDAQEDKEQFQSATGSSSVHFHTLPKGYPQKQMYKLPKIDAVKCQTSLDPDGLGELSYLGSHVSHLHSKEALKQAVTYSNQDMGPVVDSIANAAQEQQIGSQIWRPNVQKLLNKKRRLKRSNSIDWDTLKFEDPLDNPPDELVQAQGGLSAHRGFGLNLRKNQLQTTKDTFAYEKFQKKRKLQRTDEMIAPRPLQCEPRLVFNGLSFRENETQLDEYLTFCETVMRDAPVQGSHCGIWLRGSCMYQENAMKLLHMYNNNFDLAKLHVLYPMVMNLEENRQTMIELARTHPDHLKQEVANAIIDLSGCKQSEIDDILQNFRSEMQKRMTEEQLKYHMTILARVKIELPEDINQAIKDSQEFSKEIKKKVNQQLGSKNTIQTDKKLKLSELNQLNEKQQKYLFITEEMITLDKLLEKASKWVRKVDEIRNQEVNSRNIEIIYSEGKNMPVNFQEEMDYVISRKQKADELNAKITDVLKVRKTRQNEKTIDQEEYFRSLLKQAKDMAVQSDQIQKLSQKVKEIDEWNTEVLDFFKKYPEEIKQYNKFRPNYRELLATSNKFNVELKLMKVLRDKCDLINWREQVEETASKFSQAQQRISLENLSNVLEDGLKSNFLIKDQDCPPNYLLNYQLFDKQPMFDFIKTQNIDNETMIQKVLCNEPNINIKKTRGVLMPLVCSFSSVADLNAIYREAINFDQKISSILRKVSPQKESLSVTDEDIHMLDDQEIDFQELINHEKKGAQLRVDFDSFKELQQRMIVIREAIRQCDTYLQKYEPKFKINSLNEFKQLMQARKQFNTFNVQTKEFTQLNMHLQPFIKWMYLSQKIVKQYCKALGLKINQLNFIETEIQVQEEPGPDYQILLNLTEQMDIYSFFKETEQGKHLLGLKKKTEQTIESFLQLQSQKRSENFDMSNYFRVLDNITHSGLPLQEIVVEQARLEHKRETWIKKYTDLQQCGNIVPLSQIKSQDTQSEKNTSGYVRLKQLEQLFKEYQQSQDLQTDQICKQNAQNLQEQLSSCQKWKDEFDKIFDSHDQFNPQDLDQVKQLLARGQNLQLRLQEYVQLQALQDRYLEWKQTIVQIFGAGANQVTLDQLEKHIKETNQITEGANPHYSELLSSLKELATIWRIKAKTILRIRPLDRPISSECEDKCWCICRQSENGNMISCDFCDMWFHYSCIGIQNNNNIEKVDYKCIGCAIREGKIANTEVNSFYSPVIPNRQHVLKELQSTSEAGSISQHYIKNNQWFKQLELSQQDKQSLQMTEKLLLEHFFCKQRINYSQFIEIVNQGRNTIPLKLEELRELESIQHRIEVWKSKSQKVIQVGVKASDLWQNFIKINGLDSKKKISDREILYIQENEHLNDQKIMDLIVENESFPVMMPEARKLTQMIQFRDWLREIFLMVLQFQGNKESNQVQKLNKIKTRKQIRQLVFRGEVLLGLSLNPTNHEYDIEKESFDNQLSNLLNQNSEIESNVFYLIWLFGKLGGERVTKGSILDPISPKDFLRGFNWQIQDSSRLVEQLSFYQKTTDYQSDEENSNIIDDDLPDASESELKKDLEILLQKKRQLEEEAKQINEQNYVQSNENPEEIVILEQGSRIIENEQQDAQEIIDIGDQTQET